MDLGGLLLFGLLVVATWLAMLGAFFLVSVVASRLLWRWALLRLGSGKTVAEPRIASLMVLFVTGFPASLMVGAIRGGAAGVSLLILLVEGACFAALIHAAYRTESIREVGENSELASALTDVPHEANRNFNVLKRAKELGLPTFTGPLRRRALLIAAAVAVGWIVIGLLIFPTPTIPPD